jgi:RNA polymerase subunit RPABC4/transcription elongation factor Spt4
MEETIMDETKKRNSTFKFVFWLLAVLVILLVTVAALKYYSVGIEAGRRNMIPMLLPLLILVPVYIAVIGQYVYKDAVKRGMDPWLWMCVAAFIPNFIGLIIYLVVRQSLKINCVNCGQGIQKDFKICPYCGQNQEMVCEKCQKEVSQDWSVCPYCAHPLPGRNGQDKT